MSRFLRRYSAWIWLSAALLVIATLKVISASSSSPAVLGASNAQPNGALALALWLQRSGYEASTATSADLGTRDLAPGDTVLVLTPEAQLRGPALGTALDWVRAGGTLLAVASWDRNQSLLHRLGFRAAPSADSAARVVQPLLLSPPVRRLSGTTNSVVEGAGSGAVVARSAGGPTLVMRRLGRGTVWLLSEPEVLDNSHLARADNRRLALNLVGPAGRRVTFDEYTPPVSGSVPVGDWVTDTTWGIAAIFALAVLLLYRFFTGWRLGPAVVPLEDRHRPAVEYVISMAGLLHRGHKSREVLEGYQAELRRLLHNSDESRDTHASETGRRIDVEQLLAAPTSIDDRDLLRHVGEIVECEEQLARRSRV